MNPQFELIIKTENNGYFTIKGHCTERGLNDAISALCKDLLQPQAPQKSATSHCPECLTYGGHHESCSNHVLPKPPQLLVDRLKDAFIGGFASVETYNDFRLNTVDDEWARYKATHDIKDDV